MFTGYVVKAVFFGVPMVVECVFLSLYWLKLSATDGHAVS